MSANISSIELPNYIFRKYSHRMRFRSFEPIFLVPKDSKMIAKLWFVHAMKRAATRVNKSIATTCFMLMSQTNFPTQTMFVIIFYLSSILPTIFKCRLETLSCKRESFTTNSGTQLRTNKNKLFDWKTLFRVYSTVSCIG